MAYSSNEPLTTPKYPISVPTHEYYAAPCIYKVFFGRKFYIGKSKSLYPSMDSMARTIERAIRTGINDKSGWYYNVIVHIKKNKVIKAHVKMVYNQYGDNWADMLKDEQLLLRRHMNDPDCLNNNFDAYIPGWMNRKEIDKFNKWKNGATKKDNTKDSATNTRKKH